MTAVPQPAKGILAVRRISNRRVAELYGCTETYAGRVLNGRDKPSARFRRFLSALLNVPEPDLFHDEMERIGGAA